MGEEVWGTAKSLSLSQFVAIGQPGPAIRLAQRSNIENAHKIVAMTEAMNIGHRLI